MTWSDSELAVSIAKVAGIESDLRVRKPCPALQAAQQLAQCSWGCLAADPYRRLQRHSSGHVQEPQHVLLNDEGPISLASSAFAPGHFQGNFCGVPYQRQPALSQNSLSNLAKVVCFDLAANRCRPPYRRHTVSTGLLCSSARREKSAFL